RIKWLMEWRLSRVGVMRQDEIRSASFRAAFVIGMTSLGLALMAGPGLAAPAGMGSTTTGAGATGTGAGTAATGAGTAATGAGTAATGAGTAATGAGTAATG